MLVPERIYFREVSASDKNRTVYVQAAKDGGQSSERHPRNWSDFQMVSTSNIDQEPAVPFSCARIQCVERLRIRSGLFECSDYRCRLGRIRAGRPCRGQPSIPEQRREPRIRIILTWGRRHGDRGDRSGRTGDRGIGVVEGVDERPRALRDCLVGRRPRSCSGQKKSMCGLNRMRALRARCRTSGPLLADPIDGLVPSVLTLTLS